MGTFTLTWAHTIFLITCKIRGDASEVEGLLGQIRECFPDKPLERLTPNHSLHLF